MLGPQSIGLATGSATTDLAATGFAATPKAKLTVADILRSTAADYVERYPQQAAPQVRSTLAKLSLCRTPALGTRRYQCGDCQSECLVYNSCSDRHCPTCGGAKRADWIDSSARLLLDGVHYFQVVFTLPAELSRLALGNRRPLYDLLFHSAWSALNETIRNEQAYQPAALMVLHTWNQKLEQHGHVHAVVPGGGPSLEGDCWNSTPRNYLVDADKLRAAYRRHFLIGLARLKAAGQLRLEGEFTWLNDDDEWKAFVDQLETINWVSYIEPPPSDQSDASQVLKYLSRYLTGGPISNHRILSADEREVTFLAREGKTPGGDDVKVPITLSALEFTRRWALHVLPAGYTKTRQYGGWFNRKREAYLDQCVRLLDAAGVPLSETADEFDPDSWQQPEQSESLCPACGGQYQLIAADHKPSWREIMNDDRCPAWYSASKTLLRSSGSG